MNENSKLVTGMYYNQPHPNSPDFILGGIAIEPKAFTQWMRENYEKGEKYIKIDIKMSKAGKPYLSLNTYKPTQGQQSPNNASQSQYGASQSNSQGYQKQEDEIPF